MPPQTIENVETDYLTSSDVTALDVKNSRGLPPPVVEWDPRFQGHFVLTQLVGADTLANAWSLDQVGVHPNASIDFSYDHFATTRKTLLLNYDAATMVMFLMKTPT